MARTKLTEDEKAKRELIKKEKGKVKTEFLQLIVKAEYLNSELVNVIFLPEWYSEIEKHFKLINKDVIIKLTSEDTINYKIEYNKLKKQILKLNELLNISDSKTQSEKD